MKPFFLEKTVRETFCILDKTCRETFCILGQEVFETRSSVKKMYSRQDFLKHYARERRPETFKFVFKTRLLVPRILKVSPEDLSQIKKVSLKGSNKKVSLKVLSIKCFKFNLFRNM